MVPTDRFHGFRESRTQPREPEGAVPILPHPEDKSDARDLQRECERLRQVRGSLERLCIELRQELRDSEGRYTCAPTQIRLLRRDVERRDGEFSKARLRVRQLEKHALRQAREFGEIRRQFRLLQQRSSSLAVGFLAITASRRWHVGHALLSIPSRLLGRRPVTVADSLQTLASALATGKASRSDARHANAGSDPADQGIDSP